MEGGELRSNYFSEHLGLDRGLKVSILQRSSQDSIFAVNEIRLILPERGSRVSSTIARGFLV